MSLVPILPHHHFPWYWEATLSPGDPKTYPQCRSSYICQRATADGEWKQPTDVGHRKDSGGEWEQATWEWSSEVSQCVSGSPSHTQASSTIVHQAEGISKHWNELKLLTVDDDFLLLRSKDNTVAGLRQTCWLRYVTIRHVAVKQSICQSNPQSACACLLSIRMTSRPRLDSLLQGAAHLKDKLIEDYFLPSWTQMIVVELLYWI
jgi:hypothetical protein